jgi:hypothetical protein
VTSVETAAASWADFEASAPGIARKGRRLFDRDGIDQVLLATVRDDEPPRIHPIYVAIVDGRLYAFLLGSAKRADLERDGRYAMHSHQDAAAPSEFMIRGRANGVTDAATLARVSAGWYFEIDESFRLFEFGIESAVLGERDSPDEWPPRYSTWPARDA